MTSNFCESFVVELRISVVIFVVGGKLSVEKEQLLLSALHITVESANTEKFMAGRNTSGIRAASAGRFPDSTWRAGTPSLYHDKCTPQKERVKSAPPRTYSQREYTKCDVVRNDEIWKNRCKNEGKMTRKW